MENKKGDIQFRFAQIMVISKNVYELKVVKKAEKNISVNYNFTINVDAKVNASLKFIIQNVEVVINDVDTGDILAKFKIAFFFEIIDFDKFITINKDGVYHIPPQLDTLFKPVCISTARGIIYAELRGTYLQDAIMPIIFMDAFTPIKQPIKNKKV